MSATIGIPPVVETSSEGRYGFTPVEDAEREFLWNAFQELKSLGHGELRITVEMDPKSKEVEIIYGAIHKKRSLDGLRRTYQERRRKIQQGVPASV